MPILMACIVPHPPIILPEIGKGQEWEIRNTSAAYKEIAKRVREKKPETIIVLSPHATSYADYFHISPGTKAHGDFARFGAKQVEVTAFYDEEFTKALEVAAKRAGIPAGTQGEREKSLDHGTMIPLTFLAERELPCATVRIGLSGLDAVAHYRLGKCIRKVSDDLNRDVVIIASGDLSHKLLESGPYGYAEEGPVFDQLVTKAMAEGDFFTMMTFDPQLCQAAAECGLGSFEIMAGVFDRQNVKSEMLSYEGPFGVGYAVAAFEPGEADETRAFDVRSQKVERERISAIRENEDPYTRLARKTVEAFVKTGKTPPLPDDLPEEMKQERAGVFVSLKIQSKLRGCIGTISAVTGSVAEEIQKNAVSACSQDPRFDPVTADELERIHYSVDVLGPAERVDGVSQLDAKRYGVIVTSGYHKGLLLPNLEGVYTVEEQLKIAKQKAGIPESERCRMERFEVVRHT
ncbi:MAG TPA: AmmeMemoRadiSam system protein A [Feifaniaceae bacterium]|nr:AmmeMemoRadiSam system protein A [Feifaniaceae bacterium]